MRGRRSVFNPFHIAFSDIQMELSYEYNLSCLTIIININVEETFTHTNTGKAGICAGVLKTNYGFHQLSKSAYVINFNKRFKQKFE